MVCDTRRSLASYASRIASGIEEQAGPHIYCSSFAVYEVPTVYISDRGAWNALSMHAPIATQLRPATPTSDGAVPILSVVWEALPLAPSMTGQAKLAAQNAACLPSIDASERKFPLERLVARAPEQLANLFLPTLVPLASQGSEVEEYSALLMLEERLLTSWLDDCNEACGTISLEARRRIEAMAARLRAAAPDDPPPGLKAWPEEPCGQWSCRTWERVCRGAAAMPVWAAPGPSATEAEVSRSLLWAEIANLQEIVFSIEAIQMTRDGLSITLGDSSSRSQSAAPAAHVCSSSTCCSNCDGGCSGDGTCGSDMADCGAQVAHIGATLTAVVEAERSYFSGLLLATDGEKAGSSRLFKKEIEDLPSECDADIAGLHAFVQTTNAELNALWHGQRHLVAAGDEAQLWRCVRLRELALSAIFLILKQAQSTKATDAQAFVWLQSVQQGCRLVLRKSQMLCVAGSALAGLPGGSDEAAVALAVKELVERVSATNKNLAELHARGLAAGFACSAGAAVPAEAKRSGAKKKKKMGSEDGETLVLAKEEEEREVLKKEVLAELANCDKHTLAGNLLLLLLERQNEVAVEPLPRRICEGIRAIRLGLHLQTLKMMLARTCFDLPLVDESIPSFAKESERRGRKLRTLGNGKRTSGQSKKSSATATAASLVVGATEAETQAAAAAAEVQASELLTAEDKEKKTLVKKKKKKQRRGPVNPDETTEPTTGEGECVADVSEENIQLIVKPLSPDKLGEIACLKEAKSPTISTASSTSLASAHAVMPEPEQELAPISPSLDSKCGGSPQKDRTLAEDLDFDEVVLLDKGPFDLLGEKRKVRLVNIEQCSGVKCVLDVASQAVRLHACDPEQLQMAKRLVEELTVEWINLAEPSWTVLFKGRMSPSGPLSRLQADCHCSVVLDRGAFRIRIGGDKMETEAAQAWLQELHGGCDAIRVPLGSHVKAPESLVLEAENMSDSVGVSLVLKDKGSSSARVCGLAVDVCRVVDFLRSSTSAPEPSAKRMTGPRADDQLSSARIPLRKPASKTESSLRMSPRDSSPPASRVRSSAVKVRFACDEGDASVDDSDAGCFAATTSQKSRPAAGRVVHEHRSHERPSSRQNQSSSVRQVVRDVAASIREDRLSTDAVSWREHGAGQASFSSPTRKSSNYSSSTGSEILAGPMATSREISTAMPMVSVTANALEHLNDGASTMAARLAREFPCARIIIGAPDEPLPPASQLVEVPFANSLGTPISLEGKMQRLQELIEQGRGETKR